MSHAKVATLGTVKYAIEGGRSFTLPADAATELTARAIKSGDGRTIKYVEYKLTASGILSAADYPNASSAYPLGTVDRAFKELREIMNTPGGQLIIEGKGIGDLHINVNSSNQLDIKAGPFCETISWRPFGNVSCAFTWEVTFTLPRRDDLYSKEGLLDYCYSIQYVYDSAGWCTRTVQGFIEIPVSRKSIVAPGKYSPKVNISEAQSLITCTCPLGFERLQHTLTEAQTKDRIDFVFVDKQIPSSAKPPGIAEFDLQHTMESMNGDMTLTVWSWTLQIRCTPMANFSSQYGYFAALAAHDVRFKVLAEQLVAASNGVAVIYPNHFSISENERTRTTVLTANWIIHSAPPGSGQKQIDGGGGIAPSDFLLRSGMWVPMKWTFEEMKAYGDAEGGPNQTGGFSKVMMDPSQDIIISISDMPHVPDPGRVANTNFLKRNNQLVSVNTLLAPFGSYIEYRAYVRAKARSSTWINYPLGKEGQIKGFRTALHEDWGEKTNWSDSWWLMGYSVRVGLPPQVPRLASINGTKVQQVGDAIIRPKPVWNAMGLILWRTDWAIPYVPEKRVAADPKQQPGIGVQPGTPTNSGLKPVDDVSGKPTS